YKKFELGACTFSIIEYTDKLHQVEMNNSEMYWVRYFDSFKNGYNLTEGGDGTQGRVFTQEERKIRSLKMTGQGNHFYGKNHTLTTRKKLSEMSSRRIGSKNSFYGKTHSKDWKEQRILLYKRKKEEGWISPNKGVPKPKDAVLAMRKNMPHRKEIIVDGIEYQSISDCSRKLGLHR